MLAGRSQGPHPSLQRSISLWPRGRHGVTAEHPAELGQAAAGMGGRSLCNLEITACRSGRCLSLALRGAGRRVCTWHHWPCRSQAGEAGSRALLSQVRLSETFLRVSESSACMFSVFIPLGGTGKVKLPNS